MCVSDMELYLSKVYKVEVRCEDKWGEILNDQLEDGAIIQMLNPIIHSEYLDDNDDILGCLCFCSSADPKSKNPQVLYLLDEGEQVQQKFTVAE